MRVRPAARLSPEALLARLLVTPRQPCSRMMRATRLREVATPDVSGRMDAFGAPQMPMLAPYSPPTSLASPRSRRSCAPSGLLAHW